MGCIQDKQKRPPQLVRNKPLDNIRSSQIAEAPRINIDKSNLAIDLSDQLKKPRKNSGRSIPGRSQGEEVVQPLSNKAKKIIDSLIDDSRNKEREEFKVAPALRTDQVIPQLKEFQNRSTDSFIRAQKNALNGVDTNRWAQKSRIQDGNKLIDSIKKDRVLESLDKPILMTNKSVMSVVPSNPVLKQIITKVQDPPIPVISAKRKSIDEGFEQFQINKEAEYTVPPLHNDIKIKIY